MPLRARWAACKRWAGCVVLCTATTWAQGASESSPSASTTAGAEAGMGRAEQRRLINERAAQEERACQARFAVTACVDEARRQRRSALAPLREQELRQDEAARRQRASQRQQAIAAKKPPTPRAVDQPASAPRRASSAPVAGRAVPGGPSSPRAPAPHPPRDPSPMAAAAAARVQAAQQRQAQAAQAQARLVKRQAEQADKGKKAQTLPVPLPAASSAQGR